MAIPLAGTDPIPSSFAVKVWLQFVTAYPQGLHFCISSNRQGDSFGAKKLKLKEKITTVLAARDGDLSSFGRS